MEALGVAASIAGILSLVSQSIEGLIKIRRVVKCVKGATRTLNSFLDDVNTFEGSLAQVRGLLTQLPNDQPSLTADLDGLRQQLESCSEDIDKWIQFAAQIDPKASKGLEAFLTQLRVVVNKDGFIEFHSRIAKHQRALGISLSIIGR
jgi:hypothetical protein